MRRWYERERRQDIRFGQALAHYFNAHSKEGARAHKAGEFYGHFLPEKEQSDEAMLAFMQAFSKSHNKAIQE